MDVVVEVERSGLVESRHRGIIARVDTAGTVLWSFGDADTVIYPRSTNKLFQATTMLELGLPLDGPLLALSMASHSAEDFHLAGVRDILALAQLDESALQTPGGITHGCSGKHAAMLLVCVRHGWPIESYLDAAHPLQAAIIAGFADYTGAPAAHIAVDGCGLPQHATTLARLAAGYAGLVEAGGPLVDAVRANPEYVSGTRRAERAFFVGAALAKSGADGVFVVAPGDGTAIALKVEDGSERPMYVAMARALDIVGLPVPGVDHDVLGGGRPVGSLRPTL